MRWYQDRLFPKLLDWATRPLYRDRQRLLQGARGRVLELGIGTGANLALYGDAVSEIHGLEPEAAMLARMPLPHITVIGPERSRSGRSRGIRPT